MKKISLLILLSALANFAHAKESEIMKDFDSLGDNKVLLEQAQALHPQEKIAFVQKRIVDRVKRHEFYADFEHFTSGGNSYFETNGTSVNYQFHINPKWSLGARYEYYFNELTPEGKVIIGQAQKAPPTNERAFIPELNWLKSSAVAQINWYPIYGKLNIFDKGIVQFDIYGILAGGQIQLRYNDSAIYQAGLGMGLWLSQHLTSRLEVKYQKYTAKYYDHNRDIENSTIDLSMGYLL